ncbi:Hypothetical protein D9617_9g025620 [Elsinoe fawcettii]|nr:Hypothetical protein D9617_9g025620 [Elsinoe fawcettii]
MPPRTIEKFDDGPEIDRDRQAPQVNVDPDTEAPKVALAQEYRDYSIPVFVSSSAFQDTGLAHDEDRRVGSITTTDKTPRKAKSRRRSWIIGITLLIVVVLGVALGAGLGIGLRGRSSVGGASEAPNGNVADLGNNSSGGTNNKERPSSVLELTGIAHAYNEESDAFWVYYQAPNGSLVEDFYDRNSTANVTEPSFTFSASAQSIVPAIGLADRSPLAAVSYSWDNRIWRHVFYTNEQGQVLETIKSAAANPWTVPTVITDGRLPAGATGLGACVGGAPLNGVRVQYANLGGYHQTVDRYFGANPSNPWRNGFFWQFSDKNTGSACVVNTCQNDSYTNVYLRNFTDDTQPFAHWAQRRNDRAQQIENFTQSRSLDAAPKRHTMLTNGFSVGERTVNDSPNSDLAVYSDIAAVTDTVQSDTYVFYQGSDNRMKQVSTLANPPNEANGITVWSDGVLIPGTKMAATYIGPNRATLVVMYQTNASEIRFALPNRNGALARNGTYIGAI